jgi:hypothetical protein
MAGSGRSSNVGKTHHHVARCGTLRFSSTLVSFLADTIILLRYVEATGELRTSLAVVKMRNSAHSRDFWWYDSTGGGLVMRGPVGDGAGAPTGPAGLTTREAAVLGALTELGEATPARGTRRGSRRRPSARAASSRDAPVRPRCSWRTACLSTPQDGSTRSGENSSQIPAHLVHHFPPMRTDFGTALYPWADFCPLDSVSSPEWAAPAVMVDRRAVARTIRRARGIGGPVCRGCRSR